MMENSSSRPIPATEEILSGLPRVTLSAGCQWMFIPLWCHCSNSDLFLIPLAPLLQKDCAVCKDQFELDTDDPAEQVVVTLPCKHPFHEPCIIPWLKSSGTCPVCRYAKPSIFFFSSPNELDVPFFFGRYELIAQPQHGGANNTPGGSGSNNRPNGPSGFSGSNSTPQNNQDSDSPGQSGIFSSLFSLMSGHGNGTQSQNNSRRDHNSSGSSSSSPRHDIPGSWDMDVD